MTKNDSSWCRVQPAAFDELKVGRGNESDTITTAASESKEVDMLVLSRKPSQRIQIGKDVTITVVRIDRNQVRLGIEAPAGVSILRDELTPGKPEKVEAGQSVLAQALWSIG